MKKIFGLQQKFHPTIYHHYELTYHHSMQPHVLKHLIMVTKFLTG